ncbi:AMP-binding protein [Hyphomicrobium sp.]|uniref:AMP-binding protein n=1 Tax=Hyphomicrobium sp. TaxID=82 RepID=UPI0025BDE1B3|nr:AMP-binding protein [Hyphomicrobium sp.]MCC7252392.1 AMP-binding protein [Hyphomicrobium sp.]
MSGYHDAYAHWQKDPHGFWADAARDVSWFRTWDNVFDPQSGPYGRWFPNALCNTCYNCLDVHVEAGRGDTLALIYDSPVTGTLRTFTYAELTQEVATLAAALQQADVGKGDRVVIYMPMVPEAVIAMLACARIGAIHSVVFGGFAAAELAARIDDARPKAILSASCGIEGARIVPYKPLLDAAIAAAAHKPAFCVVLERPEAPCTLTEGRDHAWSDFTAAARAPGSLAPCVPVLSTDPLYILYTSGTTGRPKGVVRDNGGHMVALKWTMRNHYGIAPGEVFWAASDVGWVVGHSYICYAPLLHGATTVLYEGKPVGTPDAGAFWRVASQHKVAALFTAPTAIRAIRQVDPEGRLLHNYDLSALRTLFLAGERTDPETIRWAEAQLKVPVVDHWWQTETGWVIAGNPVGLGLLPVKPGSPTVAMPGYDIRTLDADGHEVPVGETGTLAVKLPLPPGCLPTLWNNDERFVEAYLSPLPGYYTTSDAGYIDADGYVFVMARTDDVINVAGHRLSTGQMEEVVAAHPDIAECAVVGIADDIKGQVPIAIVVLTAGVDRPLTEIEGEVVHLIRDRIGPVAALKRVIVAQRLPKTRSGKILRGTMRRMASGELAPTPATIEDPAVLNEIADIFATSGLAPSARAPR